MNICGPLLLNDLNGCKKDKITLVVQFKPNFEFLAIFLCFNAIVRLCSITHFFPKTNLALGIQTATTVLSFPGEKFSGKNKTHTVAFCKSKICYSKCSTLAAGFTLL